MNIGEKMQDSVLKGLNNIKNTTTWKYKLINLNLLAFIETRLQFYIQSISNSTKS